MIGSIPCAACRALPNWPITRLRVWTDHEPDPVKLAARLQEAEALVLFRERTKVGADLLAGLPNLKLISQRSVYPHVDVPACTAHGKSRKVTKVTSGSAGPCAAEHWGFMDMGALQARLRATPKRWGSMCNGGDQRQGAHGPLPRVKPWLSPVRPFLENPISSACMFG